MAKPHVGNAADANSHKMTQVRRFGRPIGVALAVTALVFPLVGEAAAQFGGGFGRGGGGFGGGGMRMGGSGPMLGDQGMGGRRMVNPNATGGGPGMVGGRGPGRIVTPGGCRGGDCPGPGRPGGRPRFPGGPGIIIGVPPLGPYGPPPSVVVDDDDDDLPPPRRRVRSAEPVETVKKRTTKQPAKIRAVEETPPSRPVRQIASRRVTGVPPAGERRFVPDQIVCMLRPNITEREIDIFLRQNRLTRTAGGNQQVALIGGRLFRYRITDGRSVATVTAALARDPRVVWAQPNYLYAFAQAAEAAGAASAAAADVSASAAPTAAPADEPKSTTAASPAQGVREASAPTNPDLPQDTLAADAGVHSMQYAIGKLQLRQAHRVGRGGQVLVAVIDSRIDPTHPELAGTIVREIDLLDDKDATPHSHGTAMAGAIVSKSRLMGVAPEAKVIALRAFTITSAGSASATSYDLTRAVDRAVTEGARVMNLSFAGPADPMLSRSLKAARDKGVVLIAAAGNAGPKAAPLYPAADANVIAVTATDADDKVFSGANRGRYIAVAAPGVDILGPAPQQNYEMSTGTSVAAAHVSGVAALLIARNPKLDPAAIAKILRASARDLGPAGPDDEFGAGLVDAYKALVTADPMTALPAEATAAPR